MASVDQTAAEQHWDEVDHLWRAVRRDLGSAILCCAGYRDGQAPINRLTGNWDRLCDLDIDAAASIYHGIEQIYIAMARMNEPNSPSEHRLRQLQELAGMAAIGRDQHPEAEVTTLGGLVSLGDEAIRKELDDVFGPPPVPFADDHRQDPTN